MLKPRGSRGSPNWDNVLLMNWARFFGEPIIFQRGMDGHSLFVEADIAIGCNAFVIDSRGPKGETGRPQTSKYPFVRNSTKSRARAFRAALEDYRFRRSEDAAQLRNLRVNENASLARCAIEQMELI